MLLTRLLIAKLMLVELLLNSGSPTHLPTRDRDATRLIKTLKISHTSDCWYPHRWHAPLRQLHRRRLLDLTAPLKKQMTFVYLALDEPLKDIPQICVHSGAIFRFGG